jgi:hypothetical protein
MQAFPVHGNRVLTLMRDADGTVQAGTPMTVTWNGTSLRSPGRGVYILRLQISRGSGGSAPGGFSRAGGRK